jgi:hypothetical protein
VPTEMFNGIIQTKVVSRAEVLDTVESTYVRVCSLEDEGA